MNTIRVAVVGDSGVGKTCLSHLLATGKLLRRSKLTVGCNHLLKLLRSEDAQFVELWDIGGQERYQTLWPLFLANLSGVILVYDVSSVSSALAVPKWAEFVARHGTFKYPLADESVAGRLGGLPVPYLVVANKSDLKSSRGAHGLTLVSRLREWIEDAWQRLLQRRELGRFATLTVLAPSRSSVAQAIDIKAGSLLASAQSGVIDTAAFDAFFAECAARSALAGSTAASRPSQRSPLGGGGAPVGISLTDGPAMSISTYRGPRKGGSAGVRSPQGLAESPWRLSSGWSEDGRIDDDDF